MEGGKPTIVTNAEGELILTNSLALSIHKFHCRCLLSCSACYLLEAILLKKREEVLWIVASHQASFCCRRSYNTISGRVHKVRGQACGSDCQEARGGQPREHIRLSEAFHWQEDVRGPGRVKAGPIQGKITKSQKAEFCTYTLWALLSTILFHKLHLGSFIMHRWCY